MCFIFDSLSLDVVRHLASKAVCIEKAGLVNPAFLCSLFKETQNILFQYFTFLIEEHRTFSSLLVCQNNLIGFAAILCRFHRRFLDG